MKKWLIIYDIRNPQRLRKVMKIISEYAIRVQLSVYELEAELGIIDKISKKIDKVIDTSDDYIIYFELCKSDWQKSEKYGIQTDLPKVENFYVI